MKNTFSKVWKNWKAISRKAMEFQAKLTRQLLWGEKGKSRARDLAE